jgi:putative MFS transporter
VTDTRIGPARSPANDAVEATSLVARLEQLPFTRWHMRARIVVGSATFFDAFDALSLAFVLPVLVREWGLSAAEIGWLIAVGYLGQFVGALVFGGLAERVGRVPSAAAATALMSVMSLACAMSTGFASLLTLRLIQGIGVGGEMPVAAAYINELSKAKGRGRFFLLYELIFPIGLMAAGQIGALVVPAFGWQVMFLIGGVPGLLITALLLRLPESPRWLIAKGRVQEAARIVEAIEASAQGNTAASDQVSAEARRAPSDQPAAGAGTAMGDPARPQSAESAASPAPQRAGWAELLSPAYRSRTVVVWFLWASVYFVTNGLNNWMPTLYNRVYGLSLPDALRAGTLTNVAQVAVLLGCAFAIDRVGRRRWTTAAATAGVALLLALALFASTSVTSVIVLVTAGYALLGSVNAVLYLYTPEIYPTRMRALGTGAATCWLRLASALGPLLVGYLVDARGPGAVFLMFAAVGGVAAIAGTQMLETRNRTLEDLAR